MVKNIKKMNKYCLVSFSSKGREDYNKKLLNLLDSAIEHWDGDYLIYSPDHELDLYKGITIHKGYPPLSRTHEENPYEFKFRAIMEAVRLGYEKIVWLDTSMTLAADITGLFLPQHGITVFHNLGHPLPYYISDNAIDILGITSDDLEAIPQIWGGALFFDFSVANTNQMFFEIICAIDKGALKDGGSKRVGFIAHRHDQAVMSVILYTRCTMLDYGYIVSKEHARTKEYGDNYYIIYG